jgi:putative ABC transport system permease protein
MVEGRYYEEGRQADLQSAVINEAAVKDLGVTDPIGKQIVALGPTPDQSRSFTIIGVLKDFNFQSLHHLIRPLIIHLYGPQGGGRYISVRFRPENTRETMSFIENTWSRFAGSQAFEYEFFDDHFAQLYRAEERTGQIFLTFSVLAIVIASLGLLGLATFVTEQRTKEIGIRKVLGATESKIIYILSKEFTKWVIASNLIAWPIAYYFMSRWIQKFAYQAGVSVWAFLLASVAVFVISLLTVSYQTVKAARTKPSEMLHYE